MVVEVKVPSVGESITEVFIARWHKPPGDALKVDEVIAEIESDKATVELPSPVDGVLSSLKKQEGDSAQVGEVIALIDTDALAIKTALPSESTKPPLAPAEPESSSVPAVESAPETVVAATDGDVRVMPAARRLITENNLSIDQIEPTGPGGRILKEDVQRLLNYESKLSLAHARQQHPTAPQNVTAPSSITGAEVKPTPTTPDSPRRERVVPMTPMRRTIAQRLVQAQQTAALLTTFNEIDMAPVMELRARHKETFQSKHKVKLGFMSFFVKAVIEALGEFPAINAEIRGDEIVYHDFYDIGIAIGSGGKGLVVPIVRSADALTFAEIERTISDFGVRAQNNKIDLAELKGGTFTITNGGVYGSMLSTPIINPPQSGILGMHKIEQRAVVRDGEIVARPMMYVALTYDHRIVDGREAVAFLCRIKDYLEDPMRLLLEV